MSENSAGLGTVTRRMLRERAAELAAINGRSAQEVSTTDREQAKRELTGDSDPGANEAAIESAPESERWGPGARLDRAPSASGFRRRWGQRGQKR